MFKGILDVELICLVDDFKECIECLGGDYVKYVFGLSSNFYWDNLWMKFVSWMGLLGRNIWCGVENWIVVVNCWFFKLVVYNLLFVVELLFVLSGVGGVRILLFIIE